MRNKGFRVQGPGFSKPVVAAALPLFGVLMYSAPAWAEGKKDPRVEHVVLRGLEWVANTQSRLGSWTAVENRYPTAMTALAGIALLQEGSTTTQGKYAPNIRRAVDYLVQPQPLERPDRRSQPRRPIYLRPRLFNAVPLASARRRRRRGAPQGADQRCWIKAVEFCGRAQTDDGGWGYVSAQGRRRLRRRLDHDYAGARPARLPQRRDHRAQGNHRSKPSNISTNAPTWTTVPCSTVSKEAAPRPAITAAAIACLFNAGDYDDKFVPKMMKYAESNLRQPFRAGIRALALRPLLLLPGHVSRRGREMGEISRPDVHAPGERGHRGQHGLLLDARLRGPDLHDRRQPDDFATRQ